MIVVLEILGVFRDVGAALAIFSLGLTLWFGITAATQRTADGLHVEIRRLRRDTTRALEVQTQTLLRAGERHTERLGEYLGRIEALLRERPPRL